MKKRPVAKPALAGSSKRAHALIECMLREMQRALRDPARLESPEWDRLFGAKQSMVVNVQKLVQALAVIPIAEIVEDSSQADHQEGQKLSPQEMDLLRDWLGSE